MNGYYLFWVLLVCASLWASMGGFLWAHRHGQFRQQERARYLPLRGEPGSPAEDAEVQATRGLYAAMGLFTTAGIFAVVVLCLAATAVTVILGSGGRP
jgi:hypothetical protein